VEASIRRKVAERWDVPLSTIAHSRLDYVLGISVGWRALTNGSIEAERRSIRYERPALDGRSVLDLVEEGREVEAWDFTNRMRNL